jgi:signal peptidase II
MPRRWKLFILIAFASLVLDQASKYWARHSLPTSGERCAAIPEGFVDHSCGVKHETQCCYGEAVPVISNVWDWRLSMNPGSAFGLFHSAGGARVFLSLIGLIALGAMGWMVKRAKDRQTWLILALGLIAGGAIGNLVDRIYFGVVTDFVLWHWKDTEWPVFNVADVVLVIGVGLLLLDVGKDGKKKPGKKAKPALG